MLHKEREELMKNIPKDVQTKNILDFNTLEFGEKKIIAAEFIDRILLNGKDVNIVWKI